MVPELVDVNASVVQTKEIVERLANVQLFVARPPKAGVQGKSTGADMVKPLILSAMVFSRICCANQVTMYFAKRLISSIVDI